VPRRDPTDPICTSTRLPHPAHETRNEEMSSSIDMRSGSLTHDFLKLRADG
jgi:hypothetical protein